MIDLQVAPVCKSVGDKNTVESLRQQPTWPKIRNWCQTRNTFCCIVHLAIGRSCPCCLRSDVYPSYSMQNMEMEMPESNIEISGYILQFIMYFGTSQPSIYLYLLSNSSLMTEVDFVFPPSQWQWQWQQPSLKFQWRKGVRGLKLCG